MVTDNNFTKAEVIFKETNANIKLILNLARR